MARHRQPTPTDVELEILHVLWERGPCTVRDVVEDLNRTRKRAYTSILSMMQIMLQKELVTRVEDGRAHVYAAATPRHQTLTQLAGDLLRRAFGGSPAALISHVLEESKPSADELEAIRQTLADHDREQSS